MSVGEQIERLRVRGGVRLALPTATEYYADGEVPVRLRVARYEQFGFVYPMPEDAEHVAGSDRPRK